MFIPDCENFDDQVKNSIIIMINNNKINSESFEILHINVIYMVHDDMNGQSDKYLASSQR